MIVGGTKDTSDSCYVLGVVVIDRRVAEVQLEAVAKVRILRAAPDLAERIVLQGIDAAEAAETIGEARDLVLMMIGARRQRVRRQAH